MAADILTKDQTAILQAIGQNPFRTADWHGFFLEEAKKLQGDIFES